MTCPSFSTFIYKNKKYDIADIYGIKGLPHPSDIFNLEEQVLSSSVGFGCQATYGTKDNALSLVDIYYCAKGFFPKKITVNNKVIKPRRKILSVLFLFGFSEWKYRNIDY